MKLEAKNIYLTVSSENEWCNKGNLVTVKILGSPFTTVFLFLPSANFAKVGKIYEWEKNCLNIFQTKPSYGVRRFHRDLRFFKYCLYFLPSLDLLTKKCKEMNLSQNVTKIYFSLWCLHMLNLPDGLWSVSECKMVHISTESVCSRLFLPVITDAPSVPVTNMM